MLSYDGNGNIVQDGNKSWTYNAHNPMSQFKLDGIVQAQYVHNAIGERVVKKLANQTTVYFYNALGQLSNEMHYNLSGQLTQHSAYIWLDGLPLALIQQTYQGASVSQTQLAYIDADHLNTPRLASNQNGQVLWQWQSDAFGNGAANHDVDGDGIDLALNLRFPGQYFDQESGSYYNYFRDYDLNRPEFIGGSFI